MKRLQPILCSLLAIMLANAHWAALKGVALTSMAVSYSSKVGVTEGLRQTFDGEHPCSMCCAIKETQAQDKTQQDSLAAPLRDSTIVMSVVHHHGVNPVTQPPVVGATSCDTAALIGRTDQPPVPPPP